MALEPVNWMKSALSMTASETSRAPCASASTSGAPESSQPRRSSSAVSGVRSDGLSNTAQPAARAPMASINALATG
nr:hypothetical protein CPGR_04837 [Mycolicibacterium malmesburyense]